MKIRTQLILTYFCAAVISTAFVSFYSYNKAKQSLLAEKTTALEAITTLKIRSIKEYFEDFNREMSITTDRYIAKNFLPILSSDFEKNSAKRSSARIEIERDMSKILTTQENIEELFFLDKSGTIVYSTDEETEGALIKEIFPILGEESFQKGKISVYSTDIFFDERENHAEFLTAGPVYDFSGNFAGVLIFEVDTTALFSLVQDTTGVGSTGETLIVRLISDAQEKDSLFHRYDPQGKTVLFLNTLRFDPNSSLKRTLLVGGPLGIPAQKSAMGENGSGINLDYREKEALSVWKYFPEKNWGIVTKIDMEEVLTPIYILARTILLFAGLIGVIIFIMSLLFARIIASPINELTETAKKIGRGDLSITYSPKLLSLKNEIGTFAQVFMKSIADLKDLQENLEKKVEERTLVLKEKEEALSKELKNAERANKLMVGRELEMVKLKKQIAECKNKGNIK